MGKYYLRTGPATTRVWSSQLTARLFTKAISVNSIDTIMGCHGIAYTYYHDAPVYSLLALSEETHDRSPVNPSTALAELTITRNCNHPDLSHRIVPCSPIEAAEAQPAYAYAPRVSERNRTAHPSLEGGNISPSLLRTFTVPHPHLHLSSHHVCSHKSSLIGPEKYPERHSLLVDRLPLPNSGTANNRVNQVSPRGGHRKLTWNGILIYY